MCIRDRNSSTSKVTSGRKIISGPSQSSHFAKAAAPVSYTHLINNREAVNQVIRSFKQHQIQISMDDFGSGYSSLNILKDLLFDEVKIDRKFLGDSLTESAQIVL